MVNVWSFFDELGRIQQTKLAQPVSKVKLLAKAAPWLAAAGAGGAGMLGLQDLKKTWELGQQVREAQERQGY